MTESMATTQLKNQLKKLVCDIIDEKFDEIKEDIDIYKEQIKQDEKERRDEEVKTAREKNNERLRLEREEHKKEINTMKEKNQNQLRSFMDAMVKNAGKSMRDRKEVEDIFYEYMGCCKYVHPVNGKRCTDKVDNTTLRPDLDICEGFGSGVRYNQRGYCLKHRPSAFNSGHVKKLKEKEMGQALREAVVQDESVCEEQELPPAMGDTLVHVPQEGLRHNHPFPSGFKSDCPKCVHDKEQAEKKMKNNMENNPLFKSLFEIPK